MTVTDTTPPTRPFFLVMRPSRIHAGYCLLWCGHDRHDAPLRSPDGFRFPRGGGRGVSRMGTRDHGLVTH